MRFLLLLAGLLGSAAGGAVGAEAPKPLKVLFLGDEGHHRPVLRFRQIQPVLARRGIVLTYTDSANALNPKTLSGYDGLLLYANIDAITPEQEKALLDFVTAGKGFIPIHCASYCFRNSPQVVDLMGAQFQKHGTGVFRTVVTSPEHPVMKGFHSFESWDETYVHTRHNTKDRVVLEERSEGERREPWTWVRTHGKGRVFYTAWGHDERTWGHPGFQNLLERGIRWAVGADPTTVPAYRDQTVMTTIAKDAPPFKYTEAKIPFYPPNASGGTRKPLSQMQLPMSPADSVRHMVTPADFEIKLFVSEKELGGKPICMNWDERGRLWVAVTFDYPNEMQPAGKGRDRILICEDTDGDGVADKITVFADKLSIPTSIAFANGGVIVHQAPNTLFLKDTKSSEPGRSGAKSSEPGRSRASGTDKADVRKVLFTGWHTNDTHAGPSNLHYGHDNWLYGMVGYAGFDGTVGGEKHSFRQGFYRFKPDGSKLEFLRNTNNNSWGVGISEEGILFGSTANGNPSVYLPIPNRYYESVRGWSARMLGSIAVSPKFYPITDKIRQVDNHGAFTAAAGHALYTARRYPQEYWNRTAFVTDVTGHLAATFVLEPRGADFVARYGWNLLASDDEWCAPIMGEVGPDGSVWVIDWYNYIVQHNPTPAGYKTGKGGAYEIDLRDKKHGRIYRLVPRNAKESKPMSLAGASPAKLVETLANDNLFWRRHAQRLLVERGNKDVVPALLDLLGKDTVDAIGLNVGAIHALWTLHGLGALAGGDAKATAAAISALKNKSAGVRRNAVAVIPRTEEGLQALLSSGALKDPEPQVRLAALLALSEMPGSVEGGKAVVAFLADSDNLNDRWLSEAAISAAAAHDLHFLKAVVGTKNATPRLRAVVTVVARHYALGAPVGSVAELLPALETADPALTGTVIAALAEGWPRSKPVKLDEKSEKSLAGLFARLTGSSRTGLMQLASLWGSKALEKHSGAIVKSLLDAVGDEKLPDEQRLAASRQVVEFQPANEKVATAILEALTPRITPETSEGFIDALGKSRAPGVAEGLVERVPAWTPKVRVAAFRVLLARPESTRILLDAVEKGKVRPADLSLDQRQGLLAHPDGKLAEAARKLLAKGGELPNPDRQKVIDELVPLTRLTGNAEAGKEVFKKNCATCHMHSGEGAKIGPDLTGMAAHPKSELLIHIFDPSRSVEGNYRVFVVETEDGRILSGMLTSETKTSLELVDARAERLVVQRSNVASITPTTRSLMPEGFEKQLSKDDVANLLEFLTRRGKYLPLALDKVATISSLKGMFYAEDAELERLIFRDWSPRTVKGVPFLLVDPREGRAANVVLLHSTNGKFPPRMPKSVTLPVNGPASKVHLLGGVSGWGFPGGAKGSVSLIVRIVYEDGKTEDHPLKNGEHLADYIRRVDVPESELAFLAQGRQQVRYLTVTPARATTIKQIDLVKGDDRTAPVVLAVTVELR
jgi:putative membrane-bound dehydrogenase-like protein